MSHEWEGEFHAREEENEHEMSEVEDEVGICSFYAFRRAFARRFGSAVCMQGLLGSGCERGECFWEVEV